MDNQNDNEDCNYRIHGNRKDSFDGFSYFLKVMPEDFSQKLSIPAAFVPKLRNDTSRDMVLQGPSAQQWVVRLWGTNTRLEFRQGWENFVRHHGIESGDSLVFKYVCKSYFKVRIFGENGCEKNIIISSENLHKKRHDTAPQLPFSSDSDDKMSDHTQAAAGKKKKLKLSSDGRLPKDSRRFKPSLLWNKQERFKSVETGRKSGGKSKPWYDSGMPIPVTESGRNKAFKDAYSFTSKKPFCLVVMKPSHVHRGFSLNFPKTYDGRLKLPKDRREVILVDRNSTEWPVRYIWSSSKCAGSLSAGWKHFTVDNNLQEGDICIFERADMNKISIKLRVHIFRVARKSTPSKRMKNEIMNDSPAGCRRSLRFAKTCNLVKPQKKEQLCDGSSSSTDGDESIDTESTSPHDMNFEPEDYLIISDSNDESHAMAPSSGALNLSPKSIPEEPLKANSTYAVTNPEDELSEEEPLL